MGSTVVAAGLCGVDEAGRGPLAGPVVAGAVILGGDCRPAGLNDSKKVSEPERARLEGLIRGRAAAWATGRAEVEEIDRLGILPATFLAMRRAVSALDREPGFLLVDGRDYPFHPRPGRAIVKGDGLSACVAAAGILAKEERDRELRRLDLLFPGWGFARHKGYGTSVHLALLRERGRLPIHRRSFRLPWEKGAEPLPLA
ncbi:MAG: ribonuclease HII [bacterium]|jgi:ribonuclease HII|nr:ribonuclease HII [bacterium]